MGWFKKIFSFLDEKQEVDVTISKQDEQMAAIAVKKLATEICINRIAMAITKCEFRTYRKHSEEKNDIYYKLNIKPNPNENATEFWQKLVHKLYHEGKALVVRLDQNFYIADSYNLDDENTTSPQVFKNIVIGKMNVRNDYKMDKVFYFRLRNHDVHKYLDQTLAIPSSLINSSVKSYRQSNGSKYVISKKRQRENQNDKDEKYASAMNTKLKSFLEADTSAITIFEGTELKKLDSPGTVSDTRDIKALINDVLEITAKAFLIPTNIATGEVTDTGKAVDDFLTFCLDGVVQLIEDELNSKLFTESEYLKGTQIKIDTQTIKHVDVLDMATAVDKLIASGVFSVNGILRILGYEPILADWADEHFLTKNYSPMQEIADPIDPPPKEDENGGKEE
jgi:HK97 family phage portal protein